MKRDSTVWSDLYNAIYFLSLQQDEVLEIRTPIFDLLDEFDTAITNGLHDSSLSFYIENSWITKEEAKELKMFRDFIDKIPNDEWNETDLFSNEDWILVRKWGESLKEKLGLKYRGWDSSHEKIIYTK